MLFNRLHRVYAVWFQISDFAFYNEFTFSTKTLAYLAYKTYKAFNAFMAFKRSRFCQIQNYRSITSFCVDWPLTIRLVYASIRLGCRLGHVNYIVRQVVDIPFISLFITIL